MIVSVNVTRRKDGLHVVATPDLDAPIELGPFASLWEVGQAIAALEGDGRAAGARARQVVSGVVDGYTLPPNVRHG